MISLTVIFLTTDDKILSTQANKNKKNQNLSDNASITNYSNRSRSIENRLSLKSQI